MILSFAKHYPFQKDKQTFFEEKINEHIKIHTLRKKRKGNRQWKVNDLIHFWMGNPRSVSKNPYAFKVSWSDKPVVEGIQDFTMRFVRTTASPSGKMFFFLEGDSLFWNDNRLNQLAINDGLTYADFDKWFYYSTNNGKETFLGDILHFHKNQLYKLSE